MVYKSDKNKMCTAFGGFLVLTVFKKELIHFVKVFFCELILSFFNALILSLSNVGVVGGM